ncbi:MAG TPA: hypothetical protein VHZ07_02975, partial [Bryobacteraceae bacterium]|nr:hypothetical protein [Bryobacteraceae bacterium]
FKPLPQLFHIVEVAAVRYSRHCFGLPPLLTLPTSDAFSHARLPEPHLVLQVIVFWLTAISQSVQSVPKA